VGGNGRTGDGAGILRPADPSVLLVEDTNPAHRNHKTRSLGGETLVRFVSTD